jgi:hypothetical protein
MTKTTPKTSETSTTTDSVNLFRCVSNAGIYAAIAFGLYNITHAISGKFAAKPIHSENFTVIQMSAAVRTLVVGVLTMGTVLFAFLAVGLIGLAIYVSIQRLIKPNIPSSNG